MQTRPDHVFHSSSFTLPLPGSLNPPLRLTFYSLIVTREVLTYIYDGGQQIICVLQLKFGKALILF